jgi:S-adenosylmethionine:diacylglycerol 3-amino-3-carboxypropyl transferase
MTDAKQDTIWARGSGLLFGQMYEDIEIERRAFPPGSRVFCISSAGCTAMALARDHDVTAVDINPKQLDYARRRADGEAARRGAADRAMQFGRSLMTAAGWTSGRLHQFLEFSDCAEQLAFWRTNLDNRPFRTMFDGLISSAWLALWCLSPDRTFLTAGFGHILRSRLERSFGRHPNRTNPYAQRLLAGALADEQTRPANPIRFQHADAATFLEAAPAGSFDAFTLSNIADGVTPEYYRRLLAAVRHAASPHAVIVLRSFREPATAAAAELAAQDRAMIWGEIEVRLVQSS